MGAFLWTITVLGVLEMLGTLRYALSGKVPERTAAGMAVNGIFMLCLAGWAFYLICNS